MVATDQYEGMLAETVTVLGHGGDAIHAYFARPTGPGPFPGVVLLHHMPGWDEWYKEATLRFAHHGYAAIAPDLYCRVGHGSPDDVAAKARADGGVLDDQVVGDAAGAAAFLRGQPTSNGKVGVIGSCSGGRHAFLALPLRRRVLGRAQGDDTPATLAARRGRGSGRPGADPARRRWGRWSLGSGCLGLALTAAGPARLRLRVAGRGRSADPRRGRCRARARSG
jgi:hypothetical protein